MKLDLPPPPTPVFQHEDPAASPVQKTFSVLLQTQSSCHRSTWGFDAPAFCKAAPRAWLIDARPRDCAAAEASDPRWIHSTHVSAIKVNGSQANFRQRWGAWACPTTSELRWMGSLSSSLCWLWLPGWKNPGLGIRKGKTHCCHRQIEKQWDTSPRDLPLPITSHPIYL